MLADKNATQDRAIIRWQDETVLETLSHIDNSHIGGVLYVSDEGRPLGFVTDGDIRRSLIKGASLSDKVSAVWNDNPLILPDTSTYLERHDLVVKNTVSHVIIVDKDGGSARIQSAAALKNLHDVNPRRCPVLLMAGGRGERLRPLTLETPKPMLDMNGVPLIERTIRMLIDKGFVSFYISVRYLKEQIMDHFGDGSDLGVTINYLVEDEPFGTGGCLRLLPQDLGENLIVMNGDLITDVDLRALLSFHDAQNMAATMVVKETSHQLAYGVVRSDGSSYLGLDEKPNRHFNINTGIYAIKTSSLQHLPETPAFTMPDFFETLVNQDVKCGVFELTSTWIDIGDKNQLAKARKMIVEQEAAGAAK